MTFGLFTNIVTTALGNIFTNMSPHPESTPHRARLRNFIRTVPGTFVIRLRSRICIIRFSPGIRHPVHAGYPSSGSGVGYTSSGPHRVLFMLAPDIPSGGTEIPTPSRVGLVLVQTNGTYTSKGAPS